MPDTQNRDPASTAPAADAPLFRRVFGTEWDSLPQVMQQHYAIRPATQDKIVAEGRLDIHITPVMAFISRLTGLLVARNGTNIPVRVVFHSDPAGRFYLERTFYFPDQPVCFKSRMEWQHDNVLIEFMRFGIGWKLAYSSDGAHVHLTHKGYVWRILGIHLSLPIGWLIGKGYASETALSANSFSMWTHVRHALFGNIFAYKGTFTITEITCDPS